MTLGELAEELATELGEDYADEATAEQFFTWIEDSVTELYGEADWYFAHGEDAAFATVAGQVEYEVPGALALRNVVDNTTALRLVGLSQQDLHARSLDITESGVPAVFYRSGVTATGGLQISFWPVPADARTYTVTYEKEPPTLDDAATELDLPRDVLRALRHAVRSVYYENAGMTDASDRAEVRYQRALARLRTRYVLPPSEHRPVGYRDLSPRGGFPIPRLPHQLG